MVTKMSMTYPLLSGLSLQILTFGKEQYGEFPLGAPCNYFGLLIHGKGHFRSNHSDFTIQEGEIVYIPKGHSYTSHWTDEKQIQFYSLAFTFLEPDQTETFLLQKLCGCPGAKELIEQMYEEEERPYRAVGLFYELYELARAQLQKDSSMRKHPVVYPAVRYIREHFCEEIPVSYLAELCSLSESYFYPTFKAEMGCSPIRFKNKLKCEKAVEYLLLTEDTLEEICDQLNVSSPAFLRKLLKQETGKTPREIRTQRHNI